MTKEQMRELKWFAKNVLGTRKDFYDQYDNINRYKDKIDRLAEQAEFIMKYCEKHNIKLFGEDKNEDIIGGDL